MLPLWRVLFLLNECEMVYLLLWTMQYVVPALECFSIGDGLLWQDGWFYAASDFLKSITVLWCFEVWCHSLLSLFSCIMICVLNWGDLPFCSYLYFDSMATYTILPVIFLLWKCCTYKYVGKICFLLEIDALFFLNIQYAISLDALLILLLLLNFC